MENFSPRILKIPGIVLLDGVSVPHQQTTMKFEDAVREITRMKSVGTSAYLAEQTPAANVNLSEDIPERLDELHAEREQFVAALTEQRGLTARMAVASTVAGDQGRIKVLLTERKITPAFANKLEAFVDRKRAEQIVALAEGDGDYAKEQGQDADDVLSMLGDLPANSTVAADPAAGEAVVQPNPTGQGDGDYDAQLDALAKQIAKSEGISYADALAKAEQQLSEQGVQAPAPPVAGKGVA